MDAPTPAELKTRFMHHAPHGDQADRYGDMRRQALGFAEHIVKNTVPCREQSLALTKLEEVVFFANAAIARREGPQ
jgi:hypothetical protein